MMKQNLNKITKSKGFKLSMSILAAVVGIGAVSGLAVGLSMASESVYLKYAPYEKDATTINYGVDFSDNPTSMKTYWALDDDDPATATELMNGMKWTKEDNFTNRFNFTELVANGSANSILDRSFQQSCYYAQTYWVHSDDSEYDTNWNYEHPEFDYEKYPLDSLELCDDNKPDANEF